MRLLRKKILTTGAIGILSIMSYTPSMAKDAPELSFYPVASWDLTQIPDPESGHTVCLMMNEYNNGFILQFQGSQEQIQSLSIDFRQNAFKTGHMANVQLTLPGQNTLQLSGQAFSPDVLAVNLAGQDAFFNSIRHASALDISVEGNDFRFFLTGYANAARSYDACMKKEAAPVDMVETPAIPAAEDVQVVSDISTSEPERSAPSPMMKDMSQKAQEKYAQELSVILQEPEEKVSTELQKALERQEAALMDEDALNLKPEPGKRYTETIADKMGTPKEIRIDDQAGKIPEIIEEEAIEVSDTASPVEMTPTPEKEDITWNGPAESKKVEITKLEMESPPAPMPPDEELETTDNDSQSIIEEIVEFVEGDQAEPQTTEMPIMAETADGQPLPPPVEMRESPPAVHNYKTPEPKVTKEVYKTEVDFTDMPAKDVAPATAKLPFSERYAAGNSEEVKKLESRLQRLERENKALNQELESALRSGEKERLDISSDNWNLEQATMRFNEAERQISRLGQQIQKERAQCTYEKKELEMMLFDPQVTEEAQLARLASLEDKIKRLEAELEAQAADYERQIQAYKMRTSQ